MNDDDKLFKIISCAVVASVFGIVSFSSTQREAENLLQSPSNQITDTPITNPRIEKLEKEVQFLKIQIEQLKQEKARMDCIRNEYKEQKDFQNCVKEKCESLETTNP